MTKLKEYVVPALIIIVAALVVSFASIPLQNTDWADGIRAETSQVVEGAEGAADQPDMGVAVYFLPLVKVAVFMGIGAFFTWLVAFIIRQTRRRQGLRAVK